MRTQSAADDERGEGMWKLGSERHTAKVGQGLSNNQLVQSDTAAADNVSLIC